MKTVKIFAVNKNILFLIINYVVLSKTKIVYSVLQYFVLLIFLANYLSIYVFSIYLSISLTIIYLFQYIGVCETLAFVACGSRCRLFSGIQVRFPLVLF